MTCLALGARHHYNIIHKVITCMLIKEIRHDTLCFRHNSSSLSYRKYYVLVYKMSRFMSLSALGAWYHYNIISTVQYSLSRVLCSNIHHVPPHDPFGLRCKTLLQHYTYCKYMYAGLSNTTWHIMLRLNSSSLCYQKCCVLIYNMSHLMTRDPLGLRCKTLLQHFTYSILHVW